MKSYKPLAVLSTAFLCAVFGTASLGSASTSTGFKPSPKQTIAPNPRPREAWVLRSVLDSKPRILSIALHNNLWLAYNTKTASLYKAWSGKINFNGPVYTSSHGHNPFQRVLPIWRNQTKTHGTSK
jgi:cytochrome c